MAKNTTSIKSATLTVGKRYCVAAAGIDEEQIEPIIGNIRFGAPVESLAGEPGYGNQDWRIRVTTGAFGTEPWRLEAGGQHEIAPTQDGFIGTQEAVTVVETNHLNFRRSQPNGADDTELIRYIKVATLFGSRIQDLDDAATANWDRDATPQTVTVDDTTDTFTATAHGLTKGAAIEFTTTGTLPAPLQPDQVYFLHDQTVNTFKVATTLDGPAIDITSTGSGVLTVKLANGVITPSWSGKAAFDSGIGDPGTIPYDNPTHPVNL